MPLASLTEVMVCNAATKDRAPCQRRVEQPGAEVQAETTAVKHSIGDVRLKVDIPLLPFFARTAARCPVHDRC